MDEIDPRREPPHDFMNVNVESFSQLPFIRRPTPPKDKLSGAIRLFGKDLVGDLQNSDHNHHSSSSQNNLKEKDKEKEKENNNNNRRFECHYCFRNFPTSQALGGHQNAHKRERQNAKRGAMNSYLHHHHQHQPADHHSHHHLYGFHSHYPSWTNNNNGRGGGIHHQTSSYYSTTHLSPNLSHTFNGTPMSLWRLSSSSSGENETTGGSVTQNRSSSSSYWPYRLKSNVQDHVSLDLHL